MRVSLFEHSQRETTADEVGPYSELVLPLECRYEHVQQTRIAHARRRCQHQISCRFVSATAQGRKNEQERGEYQEKRSAASISMKHP
jgi:hypothetical protein